MSSADRQVNCAICSVVMSPCFIFRALSPRHTSKGIEVAGKEVFHAFNAKSGKKVTNVTAFAKYIGMNASLLRQYASGKRSPKLKSLTKIRDGLQKFKNDINVGTLIEKPVLDYVK